MLFSNILIVLAACLTQEPADTAGEVYEFNIQGVQIAADSGLRTMILSSETGLIELEHNGQSFKIQTPTESEAAQELPANLSLEQRNIIRQRLLQQRFSSLRAVPKTSELNEDVLVILNAVVGRGSSMDVLSLTAEQLAELQELSSEYDAKIREANTKFLGVEEPLRSKLVKQKYLKLRSEYRPKFSKVLLPHQLEHLAKWSPRALGAIKTVTETPIGEILGLTKTEIESLRSDTDKVVEELKKASRKAREQVMEIYEQRLTERQRKLLQKHFGRDRAKTDIFDSSISNFIFMLDFDLNEKK